MSIKDKLPYTEAAVMEVLRMSVTAPVQESLNLAIFWFLFDYDTFSDQRDS